MKGERYIINEAEITLLERFEGITANMTNPERYDDFPAETLAVFCRMKDRSNDLFFRRAEAAREVINLIAKRVGINPEDTGFWLYAPDLDGTSPILKRIDEWLSRSGEKAMLKRKITELEQENDLLKRLLKE